MNIMSNDLQSRICELEVENSALKKILLDQFRDKFDANNLKNGAELLRTLPYMDKNQLLVWQVCQITGISIEQIRGRSRKPEIVTGRFAVYYALYEINRLSLKTIGMMFGRDHASVLHGKRTFMERAEFKHNPEFHLMKKIETL